MSDSGVRPEIRQLTGVRFIAAIWVVLYHFQFMIFGLVPELHVVGFLFGSGYLAVDLFFVLSGYIIAYQYLGRFPRGRGPYGRFLVKRLARIYPLQFVTLLLAVVVIVTGVLLGVPIPYPENFTVWGGIQDLLLFRGWEAFPRQGWNFPAWSLSAEWFAYLMFPLVALLVGAVRGRRGRRGAGGAGSGGAGSGGAGRPRTVLFVVLAGCLALEGLGAWLLPSFNGMPHPLVRVLAGFVAGAALFAIGPVRVRGAVPTRSLGVIGLVAIAVLISADGLLTDNSTRAIVTLAVVGVAVAGLAHGSGPPIRWLSGRPLDYGGRISYGIYMIHGIVLMVFGALLAGLVQTVPRAEVLQWPVIERLGLLLIPLVLVLVLGALLYHLVERPAQRWIVSLADRHPARRVAPGSVPALGPAAASAPGPAAASGPVPAPGPGTAPVPGSAPDPTPTSGEGAETERRRIL